MTTPTYCYSTDEEDCFVGHYATREEALGAGCETALDEQRATVWTGIVSGVPARFVARAEDVEEHDVAEFYADACQQHIVELRAVTAERDALLRKAVR